LERLNNTSSNVSEDIYMVSEFVALFAGG